MKKEILLLLTMISIICLTAFTTSGEAKKNNPNLHTALTKPTVTINYPSDFTRYLSMKFSKKNAQLNKKTPQAGPYFIYYWWDFNGNMLQQANPSYYSLDGDQAPDCPNLSGTVYCEIRALAAYPNDDEPDLQTKNATRYLVIQ